MWVKTTDYFFSLVFIILLTWPQTGQAFLEDVQEALSGCIYYLKQGLKMVQKVEAFVDNTIGEDCQFVCDNPQFVPRPNQNHKPTTNGCGSLDFLFDDSEESVIHVEKEFSSCCDTHDFCYDTCGQDKDDCDLKFKRCLYSSCKSKKHEFFDAKKCRLKAKLFLMAVLGIGCQSFIDAQRQACICVLPSKSEL